MSDTDATREFLGWISSFQTALTDQDILAVTSLFHEKECYWRDLVSVTWSIATMEGRDEIAHMLASQLRGAHLVNLVPEPAGAMVDDCVEGWFDFETASARGKGHVRLRDGRCWTLMTAMLELKGLEEPAGLRRAIGTAHEASKGRHRTWLEDRQDEDRRLGTEEQPDCLIVGGGQAGLALAARLKRLGVPTLVVDACAKPGDAWRRRYRSLYLHDPVWADHLPYLPFPDHWPIFMSKDKIADWLEIYAKVMELNIWSSTTCTRASYDSTEKRWSVQVDRDGTSLVLHPRQLVLATGLSGSPTWPRIKGVETFKGVQYHSSQHRDGALLEGKNCIVLGSNNSAHDICVDLWSHDAKVTMIQRTPTTVVKLASLRRHRSKSPLSETALQAGITTERADLMVASLPFRVIARSEKMLCDQIREEDSAFYGRLAESGFQFDFGEDGSGIVGKYLHRASGYYIDVGGSELVANGEIEIRSGTALSEIRARSVVLDSGEELKADALIYATGFEPMHNWIASLISEEVAAKVGPIWGLGSDTARDPGPWEGELRNMWKPTAQEGLWLHGGNLAQSRFYSLHLALQIKARLEGITMSVYNPAPKATQSTNGG